MDIQIILSDNKTNRDIIIAFGGMGGQFGIPLYEFKNFLIEHFACNIILVRDYHKLWYHKGIRGFSTNIDSTVDILQKNVTKILAQEPILSPPKLLVTGMSSGGYAGILFGVLLKADVIVSFVPQTFIDPVNIKRYKDYARKERLDHLYANCASSSYYDLLNITPNENQLIEIYHGIAELDTIHAKRMTKWKNVLLHQVEGEHQNLVSIMKHKGELLKCFSTYIKPQKETYISLKYLLQTTYEPFKFVKILDALVQLISSQHCNETKKEDMVKSFGAFTLDDILLRPTDNTVLIKNAKLYGAYAPPKQDLFIFLQYLHPVLVEYALSLYTSHSLCRIKYYPTDNFISPLTKIKTPIVILAGGKGTRMEEFKPLVKINNICMIDYVIWMSLLMGSPKIVVVTGYQHQRLKKHLSETFKEVSTNLIEFAFQPEPKGTVDAVSYALPYITDFCDMFVVMGDMPTVKVEVFIGALDHHYKKNSHATCITTYHSGKFETATKYALRERISRTLVGFVLESDTYSAPEHSMTKENNTGAMIFNIKTFLTYMDKHTYLLPIFRSMWEDKVNTETYLSSLISELNMANYKDDLQFLWKF